MNNSRTALSHLAATRRLPDNGLGWTTASTLLRNTIAHSAINLAGRPFAYEHPLLVKGHSFCSADIFVKPPAPAPGCTPGNIYRPRHNTHPFNESSILVAASRIACATEIASIQKDKRLKVRLQDAGVASID
eukprot:GFKZ01012068.1.p2 GENE.GFKZ01012068.1~~GFKZ01012068.1.p2  ORF type:complete len:132 (+),score=2.65 GFKZ01012068.1:319-714(+)